MVTQISLIKKARRLHRRAFYCVAINQRNQRNLLNQRSRLFMLLDLLYKIRFGLRTY